MAAIETAQYERDLRSARKEWKRTKDSSVKWSRGRRPLPGISFRNDRTLLRVADFSDSQLTKSRPSKRHSDFGHRPPKAHQNIIKGRPTGPMPDARIRSKLHAASEIREADPTTPAPAPTLTPPSPASTTAAAAAAAAASALARRFSNTTTTTTASLDAAPTIYYSFDQAESPGQRALTLEVFVKTTGRETERLVEREYEVLDGNGEALKGRRARRVLRRASGPLGGGGGEEERREREKDAGEEGEDDDDEGFELV